MPPRNITVIFLAMLASVICYRTASRNRHVGTLAQAMNLVVDNYVDEVDERALFEGAMEGMIDELDPYSRYTPPDELPRFRESIDQEFPGIGIVVEMDEKEERLRIKAAIPKLPAFKAGLRGGDLIMQIDDLETKGKTLEECTKTIRGPEGTKVTLTVLRKDSEEPRVFDVERTRIPIESVKGERHDASGEWIFRLPNEPRIGYIRLVGFGDRTVEELEAAIETFGPGAQEIDGLILDLRGNPGGLLTAGVGVADAFIDQGLIVSTRGRNKVELEAHHATRNLAAPLSLPLVVLIDGFSASASEIVAAGLQDHGRAAIVGQRSWGKGTVQKVYMLEGNRSALRLTFATYWRPSNKDIHKRRDAKDSDDWGVRPDPGLEVVISKELAERLREQQLERDLEVIEAAKQSGDTSVLPEGKSPLPNPVSPSPETPPAPEPEAEGALPKSIPAEDPQLKRAIEVVKEKVRA
jgi:carboxyl-terminal processing protease